MLADKLEKPLYEPVIETQNLTVRFPVSNRIKLAYGGQKFIHAVNQINLEVERGEIVSIVGESGSGKTTLSRTIAGLVKPTSGTVKVDGEIVDYRKSKDLKKLWKKLQMIFQDPYSTFNPLTSVFESIAIPLRKFGISTNDADLQHKIKENIERVGLSYQELQNEYPNRLSGGQKQRLSIARALAVEPEVLIADEPVSMLDVSLRSGILDLLGDLNAKNGVTIIFITHDLAVAQCISNRIVVMFGGEIMEIGPAREVIHSPLHPYTQILMSASPKLTGETDLPKNYEGSVRKVKFDFEGCRFYTNCPLGNDLCTQKRPFLEKVGENHYVACAVTCCQGDGSKPNLSDLFKVYKFYKTGS
ncbi:MAG TPA: oligopeptide/dipeptide ABC transporter ATP-binding protein [Candidatus Bathyarchaeia archaeon]|nr:oligopeptide/dipeptide ABC transporter ATP-binding protein [Candidatus Bathyarchaeia archaeon]